MNKIVKIVFLSMLFLFSYSKVSAATCDSNFKQQVLKKANDITINYELIEEESLTEEDKMLDKRFKFKFSNIPSDIVIEDDFTHSEYSNETMKSEPTQEGVTYKFYYFYTGNECDVYLIKTKTITVPYYNEFWDDEICKDLNKFKYCQKTTNVKIKYDFLEKEVEKYKNNSNNGDIIENQKEDNNIFNNKILLFIIPTCVVAFVTFIIIILKRKKRKVTL